MKRFCPIIRTSDRYRAAERYDGLVSTFSKERVPATGTTLGLDRIQTALTELGKFEAVNSSTTQVLVARFDAEGMSECLQIASELRRAGLRVEVWYDDDKLKRQFAYADKQGIPLVVMAGPDERARGSVGRKESAPRRAERNPAMPLWSRLAKNVAKRSLVAAACVFTCPAREKSWREIRCTDWFD